MELNNILSRKTNSNQFIPEIDGLRFIAIITVVFFHLNTAIGKEMGFAPDFSFNQLGGAENIFSLAWWWVRLDLGVKLFFAISGFVLALPFLSFYLGLTDKKVSKKAYFTRRLLRLEPPFIISLLLFSIVHLFLFHMDIKSLLAHLLSGLLYLHVFLFGEPNPINPVTWSLETEAQFYILVPFLFLFLFKWRTKWPTILLFFLLLLLSVIFKNQYTYHRHLGTSILVFFINFGMGILACYLYLKYKNWIQKKSVIFDLKAIVAILGMFYFYKPQGDILNILFFNSSILLLFISSFKSIAFNWIITRKIIYIIGGMCYSIYLIHFAFFHLSLKLTVWAWVSTWSYSSNLMLQVLLNVPLVLFISIVFFVFCERPFMNNQWLKVRMNGFYKSKKV
jgi:peptidoglycan/LPS O-acetylase OafA/YrhL